MVVAARLHGCAPWRHSRFASSKKQPGSKTMLPSTTEYHGIEIRYGWSAHEDKFYAYFDLPARRQPSPALASSVQIATSPRVMPGKNKVEGATWEKAVHTARSKIDEYFHE
jgi:hypothetical protein